MILHFLVSELEREGSSTARLLDRVPREEYGWRPHPRSTTLGDLAYHLATMPRDITEIMRSGHFDVRNAKPRHIEQSDPPATLFRRLHAEAIAGLKSQDEEWGRAQVEVIRNDRVLFTLSRASVLRTMLLNHGYHHRGQLTVYLRLLHIPVPALFGTSADENAWDS